MYSRSSPALLCPDNCHHNHYHLNVYDNNLHDYAGTLYLLSENSKGSLSCLAFGGLTNDNVVVAMFFSIPPECPHDICIYMMRYHMYAAAEKAAQMKDSICFVWLTKCVAAHNSSED